MKIKLKQQLIFSMIAALLLPLIISTFFFNSSIRQLIDERLTTIELPTALGEVKNGIEMELQRPIFISKAMSQNTYLSAWLSADEPESEKQQVQSLLSSIKNNNDAISAYLVSATTGSYHNMDGLLKTLSPLAERDQWFYNFIKGNSEFDISLDIDEASGQPTVFINYAVTSQGRRIGVTGIGQSLNKMSNLVRNYKLGKSGQVYLVDAKGYVKIHKDSALSGSSFNAILGDQNAANTLLGGSGVRKVEIQRNGNNFIAASIPLDSTNWYLIAEIPTAELYEGLDSTIFNNILLSLAVAIIFLVIIIILANRIIKPLLEITEAIEDITQKDGDLTARLAENRHDEIGDLAKQVNIFIAQLQRLCRQIVSCSQAVSSVSVTVGGFIDQTASRTEQQQLNTDMVATAINEMGATVNEIAKNASEAALASKNAHTESAQGQTIVNSTVLNMSELSKAMDQSVQSVNDLAQEIKSISSVLDVIKGVSEQTNLLALNAAIEAARAGEQGRGFAVVADEVRTLAQRTAQSTEEINEMIARLDNSARMTVQKIQQGNNKTSASVNSVENTGAILTNITEKVNYISDMNYQIATATEEQSLVTEEINKNVQSIAHHSQMTQQDILQCKNLCAELDQQARMLETLMGRFTL